VPAWPISIGVLTPRAAFRAGDLQPLRPDRIVMPAQRIETQRRMMTMLALMFVTLFGWVTWWSWRRREDARRLPFARAWKSIRTRQTADIDTDDQAWVSLHRALDETAGQVVHARSLNALLDRAPWLEALRTQLEAFYASSQQRFFSRDLSPAAFPLRAFARALYRAEKKRR
jgi:mxaA protein